MGQSYMDTHWLQSSHHSGYTEIDEAARQLKRDAFFGATPYSALIKITNNLALRGIVDKLCKGLSLRALPVYQIIVAWLSDFHLPTKTVAKTCQVDTTQQGNFKPHNFQYGFREAKTLSSEIAWWLQLLQTTPCALRRKQTILVSASLPHAKPHQA